MIGALKKINRPILYFLVGVAATFMMLGELLMITGSSAYSTGTSFAVLLVFVVIFSVLLFALLIKVMVHVAFRINGAIFTKKSGMLYPFPIGFTDFEGTSLAFLFPVFFLCGVLLLPVIFFPTLSRVFGAIRTVAVWGSLALIVRHFVKNYSHDYDRKSLAFSLSVVPIVLLFLSLALLIVEVVR